MPTDQTTLIRDGIRSTMVARDVSEAELSRRARIARSTLARKLAGASEFTVNELMRVAEVLDVPLRVLIEPASAA
jgi:transcriptional regulator with XRE-family HTH domain